MEHTRANFKMSPLFLSNADLKQKESDCGVACSVKLENSTDGTEKLIEFVQLRKHNLLIGIKHLGGIL